MLKTPISFLSFLFLLPLAESKGSGSAVTVHVLAGLFESGFCSFCALLTWLLFHPTPKEASTN